MRERRDRKDERAALKSQPPTRRQRREERRMQNAERRRQFYALLEDAPIHLKIGVIGSRKFADKELVQKVLDGIRASEGDFIVVSGGCEGVDTWAVEWAKQHGLPYVEKLPEKPGKDAYFARNKLIAEGSTRIVAFIPSRQMRSGAWNTVKWARLAGVPYTVLDERGEEWDRRWKVRK